MLDALLKELFILYCWDYSFQNRFGFLLENHEVYAELNYRKYLN